MLGQCDAETVRDPAELAESSTVELPDRDGDPLELGQCDGETVPDIAGVADRHRDGDTVKLPPTLAVLHVDPVTVPLQLSVDVAAFDNGSDFVVVGVLISGAQKGPMLAVDRCVPSIEINGDSVPNVVIVRVPVGKPVLENTGDVLIDELVDIDTDLEREGEFVAVLHTESVDEMLVVVELL